MTVIAAIVENGHVYMSGDSAVVSSGNMGLQRMEDHKVFKKKNVLFGTCGAVKLSQIIRYFFEIPTDNESTGTEYIIKILVPCLRTCLDENDFLNGDDESFGGGDAVLIGYKGKIYTIYQDFTALCSIDGIESIGSASDIALGALAVLSTDILPKRRLDLTMLACEKFNSMVRAPFCMESI